jgi:hypothetical protein
VRVFVAEHIHTGSNFVERSSGRTKLVRFVRVTYVRPVVHHSYHQMLDAGAANNGNGATSNASVAGGVGGAAQPPTVGFAYRTFTPAPVKVAMCSGQPEYEPFSSTWDRARAWITVVSKYSL